VKQADSALLHQASHAPKAHVREDHTVLRSVLGQLVKCGACGDKSRIVEHL
jgi:hypothetical protein